MLIELFIFFEIVMIGMFITSFFTKQEILWAITLVLSSVLMYTSYNVEYYVYEYNITTYLPYPVVVTHSYPYLMGINLIFSALALILGMFDLFDKYGTKVFKKEKE